MAYFYWRLARLKFLNICEVKESVANHNNDSIFNSVSIKIRDLVVGPCQHGMARPQVAGRGTACNVWVADANILNKQSRTADEGWSSSLGVGRGANNPSM